MTNPNNVKYSHLNESAQKYLNKSTSKRINYINSSRWIGYPKAKDIVTKLHDLLAFPKRHRMPNMLIIGESNSGKTAIAERFLKLNPGYDRDDGEGVIIPALYIQAPPVPSEPRLYSNILERIFAPYSLSDSTEKKHQMVLKLLKHLDVRMLIIDEIHLALAGNLEKQRVFLSVIRNLGNELKIPIVGLGTKDALRAVKTDPQLDNRFKPILLSRWEYNTDYRRLLASFERMIPLKNPSKLSDKAIAMKLLSMSEGILGELSDVISEASILAINTGKEQIDLELLNQLDWLSPTKRSVQNA